MRTRSTVKLVREGDFLAEVPVALVENDTAWLPYLTIEDATKLDEVRLGRSAAAISPPPPATPASSP
jgi:hypothetical protein